MKQTMIAAAISAALLAGAAPAWADAQGSAVLSNLRIELVDLAPDDGVEPSLTAIQSFSETSASLVDPALSLTSDYHSAYALGQSTSAVGSATPNYAIGTINGALSTSPITLLAQSGTDTPMTLVSANANIMTSYKLSAHTELIFEGDESILAELRINPVTGLQESSNNVAFAAILTPDILSGSQATWRLTGSESFRFTFSNLSDADADLWLEADVSSSAGIGFVVLGPGGDGGGPGTPVPEPSNAGLLIAGLGALALARRRATGLRGRKPS